MKDKVLDWNILKLKPNISTLILSILSHMQKADWQNELCHGISRIIWQLMSWLKGKIFITFALDDF